MAACVNRVNQLDPDRFVRQVVEREHPVEAKAQPAEEPQVRSLPESTETPPLASNGSTVNGVLASSASSEPVCDTSEHESTGVNDNHVEEIPEVRLSTTIGEDQG